MSLFVSNWSSHATAGAHGSGRKWSIMARPRRWEHGDGSVPLLVPDEGDLLAVKGGGITHDEYRERFLRLVAFRVKKKVPPLGIVPGLLLATTGPVTDGDTLLCACAVADARAGRCHRSWSAALLHLAGWQVVLDGTPLTEAAARALVVRA